VLEDLSIKDFALIDSAHVDFSRGFTVLSGETGAGKSLLIGAITFLLGGKGGAELIRTGASEAVVSGTFLLDEFSASEPPRSVDQESPQTARDWLAVHGIVPEGNRILLRRFVRETGKSGAWIGDTAVTRSDLASFSTFLIDIHGQHEHQSLLRVGEHRKFLDAFAGITDEVAAFVKLYTELVSKRSRLVQLTSGVQERTQKIELLTFAIQEITDAKLHLNEDSELEAEEKKLGSFEKLYADIETINQILENSETGEGIISLLKKSRSVVQHSASLDTALENLSQRFESTYFELADICEEYRLYEQNLAFDPARLAQVQDRQTLIYQLKKKYASMPSAPLSEVLDYVTTAQKELESLDTSSEECTSLQNEIVVLEKNVYNTAKVISHKRHLAADSMAAAVISVLSKLGMPDTRFAVGITDKTATDLEQSCSPYGIDTVEFIFSANKGSPLLPLEKIASGGELSRVMLALKTVLCESDSVETLIFDEIDTGIGGEVAVSVGNHLKKLAVTKQILCITHLASIAVYADNQIKIEKNTVEGITHTSVYPVSGNDRVAEIARMLSGDTVGNVSLDHAREMLVKYSSSGGI
jgi:DNA repair protein RecN (Recombination protein N)